MLMINMNILLIAIPWNINHNNYKGNVSLYATCLCIYM